MKRLCIDTRGIGNWRERLASPDRHWRREFSAMETAASWEGAAGRTSGLPEPLESLFNDSLFTNPVLMVGIAEHKVKLLGLGGASQCDVWALINTDQGVVSLSVEAKAQEPFGQGNESLADWLVAGTSPNSLRNRSIRWDGLKGNLPVAQEGAYFEIPYQMLHRCAAAVIEARQLRLPNAMFIVQAFEAPPESFQMFSQMAGAMGIEVVRGRMGMSSVGDIQLGIGWIDCPLATDQQLANLV